MTTTTEAPNPQLEAALEANRKADTELAKLAKSVTQGEWLSITRYLDMTRRQIADHGLTTLVLAYVKEKREHGAASWDILLELTDEELLKRHGFVTRIDGDEELTEALEDAEEAAAEAEDQAGEE